jgi:LmbE family N-acetylglucosaminyl deacetylase
VLFSTHGDDEHLYFAGLLPTYAAQRQCRVQVVYLTDHRNDTNKRTHEMLNGLWKVGVRAYPVFGRFADFRVDSLQGTYDRYKSQYGTSREELLGFVVEQIRRFRPLVAVGHDLKGEYGHGMHLVYADLLTQAVELTADEANFPDSAAKYGLWNVPKLYLHLYKTDPIVLDYDQPLDAFDGLTAFQVSQKLGFPSHKSQQWPMFVEWIYGADGKITKASQIKKYSPCKFGLYRSTVGSDVLKNDFLENITT